MRRLIPAFFMMALLPLSAMAGQVATFSQMGGEAPCTMLQRFEAPHMTMEYRCGNRHAFGAFNAAQNTGWMATENDRSYYVMNAETIKQASAAMEQAKAMMGNMQKLMAGMPAAQQKSVQSMIEKQMGGMDLNTVLEKPVAAPTGQMKTVGGVACTVWNMMRGGKVTEKNCIVAPGQNPKVDEIYKGFAPYRTAMRIMLENVPMVPKAIADSDAWMVVEVEQQAVNGPRPLMVLQKLEDGKLDPALLNVPAGYTKKALPGLPKL